MLEELKERFDIKDCVSVETGAGEAPMVNLRATDGSTASVYLHGAHVTSWRTSKGEELLYLSPKAEIVAGKAIRGGVPIIFPQFSGQGPLPAHGFARNQTWELRRTAVIGGSGEAIVELALQSNESTRKIWDFKFNLVLTVTLGESLSISMQVKNTGSEPFTFQDAYHTYFAVSDISSTGLIGLSGVEFTDFLDNRSRHTEERKIVTIEQATDRIYANAPSKLQILDRSAKRTIVIQNKSLPDVVVWNPWIEKCAAFKDLPPDAYKNFICVEGGNIERHIALAPGETHIDGHQFSVK